MVRAEYIISNGTYFRTGVIPAGRTKVYIDFEVVSNYTGSNNYLFGVFSPSYYSNGSFALNAYGTNYLRYYIGGKYNDNAYRFTVGDRYRCTLSTTQLQVNDITTSSQSSITITGANLQSTTQDLTIGALNAILDNQGILTPGYFKFYEIIIYENNTEVAHYLPYGDNETGYGYLYDSIGGSYLTANEPNKTTFHTSFSINPDSISLPYSGGSSVITITSLSDWSASTNDSWITFSPSSGTSDISCTVNVGSSLFTNRNGAVTFTDGENTADLTVSQSLNKAAPYNNLFRNGNRIN